MAVLTLCCAVSAGAVLWVLVLCCAVSAGAVLCCERWCCAVLWALVLCCAVLWALVLCCAVLWALVLLYHTVLFPVIFCHLPIEHLPALYDKVSELCRSNVQDWYWRGSVFETWPWVISWFSTLSVGRCWISNNKHPYTSSMYRWPVHSSMCRQPVHSSMYRQPVHTAVYRSTVHRSQYKWPVHQRFPTFLSRQTAS